VDEVGRRFGTDAWRKKDNAAQLHVAARAVVLVKPLSYMNDSGIPLSKIARWWKTPPESVLVVVDELDLPFGRLRMRESGGSAGHNGLKSIIEHFGQTFPRLRVGIGRGGDRDAIDRVLSTFDAQEERALDAIVGAAADGVIAWLESGPSDAMNLVNGWRSAQGEGSPPA
jgi:PTH1 family peptidyl-tRNA hydrolase